MANILKAYSQVKPYGAFIRHWYENMVIRFPKKYVYTKCSYEHNLPGLLRYEIY